MTKPSPNNEELIAPCGMNCAICSNFLAYENNLNKSQCSGCRPSNKKCTYLFEKCTGLNHSLEGNANAKFCFECGQYPCREINRMDRRYRDNYAMSVKDNLERIRADGVVTFAKVQYKKYQCSKCRGLSSIHNRKCFRCDTITKLVEKQSSRKSRQIHT
jgi:hypothetical protein